MDPLRRILSHRRTVRACQIVIGLLFAAASLSKIGDIPALALQVHNFRIVPIFAENLVAIWLPWIEFLAALSLLLGVRPRSGAVLVSALLAAFTLGVALAMARGLNFECGCFGTADHTRVGVLKLAENAAMLAVALAASVKPS